MVHEGCCKNFPTRVGNLKASTTAKENPQDGYNNLSDSHAAVDRVRRVAVEDLVFSQEDKPKRHRSAREISCETVILCSSAHVHGIITVMSCTSSSNDSNDVVLSCCLKPIAFLVSFTDKQSYRLQ